MVSVGKWGASLFGVMLILAGTGLITTSITGFVGGILLIVSGTLATPQLRGFALNFVSEATDRDFSSLGTLPLVLIIITGTITGILIAPIGVESSPNRQNGQSGVSTTTSTTTPFTTSTPTSTSRSTPSPTSTLTPTFTATPSSSSVTATVTRVIDGDTVEVTRQDGTTSTVRLVGVDTPETFGSVSPDEFGVPDTEAGRSCLSGHAKEATEFTTQQLSGESVTLRFDENEGRRGSFGRLLAYVFVGNQLFNDDLVRQGLGRVYDEGDATRKGQFLELEQEALSADRGVWDCQDVRTPTPTSTPTSSTAQVIVSEINADAEGNDNDNPNGEWIEITNTGDTAIDISGWTVSDAADHVYSIPETVVIDSDETIRIYTGNGEDTETELYWGSGSAIWNNGGDTVTIENDEGEIVVEREYD